MYSIKTRILELRDKQDKYIIVALIAMVVFILLTASFWIIAPGTNMWPIAAIDTISLIILFNSGTSVYNLHQEITALKSKQNKGEEFTS